MWQNYFQKIKEEKESYNENINNGASTNEVTNFLNDSQLSVPLEYIEILKKCNGFEFNGFILYGIDSKYLAQITNQKLYGLIELNQIWHEEKSNLQYIFLGESNISFYAYSPKGKNYFELDNPSGSVIQSFKTLDDMLYKFFTDAIL
ncbi:YrhA family protein [Orbus wheelerorum]|uniref:YrhA family protein n=1 Tax=Orbus wheelerorum TaxID=3074111 RepID=UPI00370D4FFB